MVHLRARLVSDTGHVSMCGAGQEFTVQSRTVTVVTSRLHSECQLTPFTKFVRADLESTGQILLSYSPLPQAPDFDLGACGITVIILVLAPVDDEVNGIPGGKRPAIGMQE